MSTDDEPSENEDNPEDFTSDEPLFSQASLEDFAGLDLTALLANAQTVDCHEAAVIFGTASKDADTAGRSGEARAFALLHAVCSFYFKPGEPDEPFGPMYQFGERRSAQPSDLKGEQVEILAGLASQVSHLGVRARLADVASLCDRKQHVAAALAVQTYVEIVQAGQSGSVQSRYAKLDEASSEVAQYLRRALQIGKKIGWDKTPVQEARDLVATLRSKASAKGGNAFRRLASLDLDFRISDPAQVAKEADLLVPKADPEEQHALLHVAARAYGVAKDQSASEVRRLGAAEKLLEIAGTQSHSAMMEAHWLERAVAELRRLPAARETYRKAKHRLVDVQSRIIDEMQTISTSDDLSEMIESVEAAIVGKLLGEALFQFVTLSRPPDPAKLREDARKSIEEAPLSSIFASTTYDRDGRAVHRQPAGKLFDGDQGDVLLPQIAMAEKIRRSVVVSGAIEPARQIIIQEHIIDETVVINLCARSPWVPPDRQANYVNGILHFFQGDMLAALHVLLPQLENSLRHILELHGCDTNTLKDDLTQEAMGIPQLLRNHRTTIEKIFGAAMVANIENLFDNRAGPKVRDRMAHGLLDQWDPFGPDAIYVCWLMFHLTCVPLFRQWSQVARMLDD
jgi:hypothetical protein